MLTCRRIIHAEGMYLAAWSHTQRSAILSFISAKPGKASSWSEISSPQHTWNLNPLAGRGPQRQKPPFFHFILCICVFTRSCVCKQRKHVEVGTASALSSRAPSTLSLGWSPSSRLCWPTKDLHGPSILCLSNTGILSAPPCLAL